MKHRYLTICLLFIGLFGFGTQAIAQVKPETYHIQGIVVDSADKKPLPFITIGLKTDNHTAVKAAVTGDDGAFALKGIKPLQYILTISAIGYQTKIMAVDVRPGSQNLGKIYLGSFAKNLKDISIVAARPIIKQEIDRISYDLQADPDSKANSVLEMMRKVPFISLDADDNILLKGNTNYKIFINGKPSSMMERDPKAILRSMPASTIQRIEVITTPPAKYDAEGFGGIINIITNKKIDAGYNGGVNVSERFPSAGPGTGASFTAKLGKFGVSAYGGASSYSNPETDNSTYRTSTDANPSILNQQGTNSGNGKTGYLGSELSYEIDSLNLVSGQFNINGNSSNNNSGLASFFTASTGNIDYDLANSGLSNGHGYDASANYQLGFKANKTQLLTFSYRYYATKSDHDNSIAVSNPVNYTTPNYNQADDETASEQTLQVDYVQPIGKINIEAGAKGILRHNNSDFEYNQFDAATSQFENVSAYSNVFNSTQDILAAYNTWQYGIGTWGFKAGVRVEQTITNANFISTGSLVHQNYFNTVPSVAISKSLKNHATITFGYGQRIKRPGINRLDPFVDRSNPEFVTTGNPDLRPGQINDLQLGYSVSKKASVNIAVTYDFVRNLDLPVSTFDPATNITTTTYGNTGNGRAAGFNFNVNYPITKQWSLGTNGNSMYFWINGTVNGVTQTNNLLTFNGSLYSSYRLKTGFRLNINLNGATANPTGFQGTSKGYLNSSVGINKDLVKNKLSFSAQVNNPFTKYRYSQTNTSGPGFVQTSINQSYYRSFRVALNYSFGKLKEEIKKTKKNINNDDVSK